MNHARLISLAACLALTTLISGCDELFGPSGGGGPVSTSQGPGSGDFLTRNPYENDHDYRMILQGQRGPCGPSWDYLQETYRAWQTGQAEHIDYVDAKRAYDRCCAEHYRGGGAGGPE